MERISRPTIGEPQTPEPQTSSVQDDCAERRMLCGSTNQNGGEERLGGVFRSLNCINWNPI